jgi:hypothetical protein
MNELAAVFNEEASDQLLNQTGKTFSVRRFITTGTTNNPDPRLLSLISESCAKTLNPSSIRA